MLPSDLMLERFQHKPTDGQMRLFHQLDHFLLQYEDLHTLLLRGYAGTGKTTAVSTLVQVLPRFGYKYMLVAPTGRAAKVMSTYAKRQAFTIHKIIYKHQFSEDSSAYQGSDLQKNYAKNTLFIVDEASMLSDAATSGGYGLLKDLVSFVFSQEGNKLMLIGDDAQLPPVHQSASPALQAGYLQQYHRLTVEEVQLTEVVRQEKASGILFNATNLRQELQKEKPGVQLHTTSFDDTFRMTSERLEDGLRYAYNKYGEENSLIICRSNKAAVQYNQYIRRAIHFSESELDAGDLIMIAKNNYTWLPNDSPAGFLANGDFAEITKIVSFEEIHGLRFAMVMLRLPDYADMPDFEAMVILDSLHAPHPALSPDDNKKLYNAVKEDYGDLHSKELKEAMQKDPYLNALQIKFAYALTCHKAQGGQWEAVFVEQGYLTEENIGVDWVRWLYTAVTRAKKELYLINFNKNFFC
ncbi:MAG: AAA family ATPase [Bacteroidetes bacterium]|nr:AAA family ATPase [Bacteroidota bacterium]